MDESIIETIETDECDVLIDEIMKQYGQDMLQLVYSYVRHQTLAEDLTQDIFVKCYQSLHTYKRKSKLKTWLWRIAINHCKDYLKSWYNKNVFISESESLTATTNHEVVEQAVIQKEEDSELVAAVMHLSINYREVIYLFYFEELSLREIADVTGTKVNTVKTRLRRAKELLKEQLKEEV